MPSLIIEQPDRRSGGRITGRVLIGRLPTNGIVVPDSNVSRLHAWISTDIDGHHFVADGGSLGGTWVNGRAIERRRLLGDGDVIRVGTAQIVYSLDDELPDGLDQINLEGSRPGQNVSESGVLFDCPCGAPAWFKATAIGQVHVCRQCGNSILIPASPTTVAEIVPTTQIAEPGVRPPPVEVQDRYEDLLHPAPVPMPHPTDEYGLAEVSEESREISVSASESEQAAASESGETADNNPGVAAREPLFAQWKPGPLPEYAPESAKVEAEPIGFDGTSVETFESASEPANESFRETAVETAEPPPEVICESTSHPVSHQTCSICHSIISEGEHTTACPSCGLTFHADCWQENLGCSAYGCPQVNALQHVEAVEDSTHIPAEEATAVGYATPGDEIDAETATFPWEFVFVALSVIGSLLGALAYGVPALIGAIGTSIYLAAFQESRSRRVMAFVALAVCVLGAGGGMYASYIWWNGWPPVGPWAHRRSPS